MIWPTVICDAFDVVVVPFPFSDRATVTRRPALVLSDAVIFNGIAGHSVLAMITSAEHSAWPLDAPITNLESAGLPRESVVRMKLFTLDNHLIVRKAGALAKADRRQVVQAVQMLLKACLRRDRIEARRPR